MACYYHVLAGTAACLQQGCGLRGDCLLAPGARACPHPLFALGLMASNPSAQSWGAPFQDAQRNSCLGADVSLDPITSFPFIPQALPTCQRPRGGQHCPSWSALLEGTWRLKARNVGPGLDSVIHPL